MIWSVMKLQRKIRVSLAVCLLLGAQSVGATEALNAPEKHYPSLPMHSDFGGPFQLTDHNGQAFTQDDLKGHYSLLYFGYTSCPDICALALYTIGVALDEIEGTDGFIVPYFINLDPQRISLPNLSEYIGNFHKNIVGLTGTDEQIRVIAGAYSIRYKNISIDAGDRKTMHGGMIFLLDQTGKAVAMYPHDVTEDWLIGSLRSYVAEL